MRTIRKKVDILNVTRGGIFFGVFDWRKPIKEGCLLIDPCYGYASLSF